MITVPLAKAKNQLSELLDRVEQGETIVVTRHGKAVARLAPSEPAQDRSDSQRAKVQRALGKLKALSGGIDLDGDIKAMAREGLD